MRDFRDLTRQSNPKILPKCSLLSTVRAMSFTHYLLKVSKQPSIRALASEAGIGLTKLHKQLRGESTLTLDTIHQLATSLNLDFLNLAVEAGLLEPEYVNSIRERSNIRVFTDQELIDELQRRLEAGSKAIAKAESPFSVPTQLDVREAVAREVLEEELKKPDLDLAAHRINPDDEPILAPAERERKAREALTDELEKDDLDLAAYRHTDGDELDYTEYN